MNARTDRKAASHRTILDSAARLVRERGIARARVADVMKGAGLTVGGFYAHFASKRALIREALRRTGADTRARLFAGLDDKPAEDRAEVIIKRYLSAAHRDERDLGCPLPAVVGEIATSAGEHRQVLGDEIDTLAGELASHLAAPTLPRRQLALALIALMVGGLSLARALRGTPLSDEMIRSCRALARVAIRARTEES